MSNPAADTPADEGGPTADAPADDGASPQVRDRFEKIRKARRVRAVGLVALVAVGGFLFVQALSAVGFFDEQYQIDFFVESLQDFFPVTTYLTELPFVAGVPFIDLGAYWAFITEQNLLFDPESLDRLLRDPLEFAFGGSLGVFSIFGQAGVTLAMGLAGTVIGFPLALLFGVLGSERVTPFPFNFVFRGTMSMIRAIPALVWALIFIPLAGLGPATATIAIATDTVGNLGRLFTDELEEIEDGPIEAMETTGASRPQTITFGMLSQVTLPYVAWTLYIFEINVRIAVSLGIIGAGGLGQILEVQQNLFQFTNAMATILCILLLIVSVELFSQRIRARLRADEEPMGIWELITGLPERLVAALSK